ncbi:hypothetical protein [Streptomyces sp. NPDC054771]
MWNDCLRVRRDAFASGEPFPKSAELSKQFITEVKRTVERGWLGDVSAVVLQQSLRDLDAAYANFFASLKGARKGPKIAEPRFKSKRDSRQAVRFTANARWVITASGAATSADPPHRPCTRRTGPASAGRALRPPDRAYSRRHGFR